jgi:hypothetical protein
LVVGFAAWVVLAAAGIRDAIPVASDDRDDRAA